MEDKFFKEIVPKSLLSGATYMLGSMLFFPRDIPATVNVFGVQIPVLIIEGAAGIIGSISGDMISDLLFPLIPGDERIKQGSMALTDALISGFVECALLKVVAGIPLNNIPKLLTYSVGHNMANEWLFYSVIGKKGFNLFDQ